MRRTGHKLATSNIYTQCAARGKAAMVNLAMMRAFKRHPLLGALIGDETKALVSTLLGGEETAQTANYPHRLLT